MPRITARLATFIVAAVFVCAQTLVMAQERRISFNIPAQPLENALKAFQVQSGAQVLYSPATVAGKNSTAISGEMTAIEGAQRLLQGSGLRVAADSSGRLTIQAAQGSAGDQQMPEVKVTARGETASGPVDGYVASRSATATKTDTPLIETPQTIEIITRDQMDAQQAQSVPQALRYATGVIAEPRGNMTKLEFVYSRGFVIDQYQDGLKLLGGSWGVSQIDAYSLERVEVLKGPASILYGQASPGGVLNLVSKRPTSEPYHDIQLQVGSFDRKQAAIDLSGPLNEDKTLLYRLTGLARMADTQADFTEESRVLIAPSLTWRPNSNTSLTLLTNFQKDPDGGFYNFVPARGTALPNPNGVVPRNFNAGEPNFDSYDRVQYGAGWLLEHRFNDVWTVRQNLRYNRIDTKFNNVFANVFNANGLTFSRYTWHDEEQLESLTLDNQMQADFGTGAVTHKVIAGLDYQKKLYEQLLGSNFGGPPTGAPPINVFNPVYGLTIPLPPFTQDTYQTQSQTGFYVQDQVKLDNWVLLLGGRQDQAKLKTENLLANTATNMSDNKFTGRAGLLYLFDSGFAPYLSYSTSFQPTTGTDFFLAPFKPTTGQQTEVGLKYQPPAYNSFMTLSAFDITQQNVLTTDPTHTGFSIQTGEIQARGVELSGVASLKTGLNLTASYSYLDPKVTKSNSTNLNKRPVSIPTHKVSLWADYALDRFIPGFGIGGGVRYSGRTYGDSINSFQVPSYTLVDAAVYLDLAKWDSALKGYKFSVNASNLTDKTYVSYCGTLNTCAYGVGRNVLATLRRQW